MTVRKTMRAGSPVLVLDILYRSPDGRKRRYRRDAQVQTRTAAEAEHRRLLVELATKGEIGIPALEPSKPAITKALTFSTVGKEFTEDGGFLATKKPSTRGSYKEVYSHVLEPKFGEVAIDAIDFDLVSKLDSELATSKLSASRRRNIHIVLRTLLRFACEKKYIAEIPKLPKLPKVGRTVLVALRREDAEKIAARATSHASFAFNLMMWAGLRPCEVRGLDWRDIDLDRGVITIRQAVCRGEEAPPKSGHERLIPIGKKLRAVLEGVPEAARSGVVAPTVKGKRWGEWGLNQAFRRAAKAAGIAGFTVYDLRHFFVTECFRRGAPAPAVQALAGHSDLSVTQRYAHLASSDLADVIARLDRGNSVETTPRRRRQARPSAQP